MRYSPASRAASVLRLGAAYGVLGSLGGAVGQAAANAVVLARRGARRARGEQPREADKRQLCSVPRTAALWGAFMATSANGRFQAIAGLDHLLAVLPAARASAALPMAVTAAARAMNRVVGGEHFAEWAQRWAVTVTA